MILTSVQAKKDRCIISCDGNEYTVSYEIALRYKLKTGMEMQNSAFFEMLDESEEKLCKEYLYRMVGRYNKTEKGYRDKLYQVGYHKKAVDKAITNAINYNYISDERYCENYIDAYKNKKGVNRLKQELKTKGVNNVIIDKYLSCYHSETEIIEGICQKFIRNREHNIDTKQKLYRHLVGKGFGYEEVAKAISKWYNDAE